MQYSLQVKNRLGAMGLMNVMALGEKKTFLLYSNTREPRWINRWIKQGFQHVSILYYDGFFWHAIEQDWCGIKTSMIVTLDGFAFDQRQDISRYYAAAGYTVQEVKRVHDKSKLRVPFLFAPQTCVEVAKAFVGLRKWWLFTPWGLSQYLKKHGLSKEVK